MGPSINEAYKKMRSEKSSTGGYILILKGSARSPFREFESYLRLVVGSNEDDIQLILKQYNSNFVSYELPPGIYTINGISEAVYTMGDHEGTLKIEYKDISMKTKLIITRFDGTLRTLIFEEKSFYNTLLGFTPY